MSFGRKDYKEAASASTFLGLNLIGWIIFFVVISIVLTGVYLGIEKWRQNRLTEIMRQTNQYVTTQQTQMMTWSTQYQENEVRAAESDSVELKSALRSQNIALCEQIRQASQRIEPQYWPAPAVSIIQGGCK